MGYGGPDWTIPDDKVTKVYTRGMVAIARKGTANSGNSQFFIVLDDSASMAASDGVRSRLDRAVSRIEQYLDELPAGSDVAVMLAADPPIDLVRQPTRDLGYVRQAI